MLEVVLKQRFPLVVSSSSITLATENQRHVSAIYIDIYIFAATHFTVYTERLQHERVTQWDSTSTRNWNVLGSNHNDALGQTLGPNLFRMLPVTLGSNNIKCSDYYWVSEAVSLTVAQSWPWNS